jgi:hypothetical protein
VSDLSEFDGGEGAGDVFRSPETTKARVLMISPRFPNRRSESVSNPYFSGDRRVNWSQLGVAAMTHNRLGGGFEASRAHNEKPCKPNEKSIAGGADEPADFPRDFPRGPLPGARRVLAGSLGGSLRVMAGAARQGRVRAESVGRFAPLAVCDRHGSNIDGRPTDHAGGGSALASREGRLVSGRQAKLGL